MCITPRGSFYAFSLLFVLYTLLFVFILPFYDLYRMIG